MRSFLKAVIVILFTSLLYVGFISGESKPISKKLIEYGWDVPSPKFVQQNIQQMEKRPFDGIVIRLDSGTQVFLHKPYDKQKFNQELESLKATKFSKFTHNFVLLWMTPEKGWDWFSDSDWAASEQNIHLFAEIVKKGRLTGIAFDPEAYGINPWNYSEVPSAKGKSFGQHWQQVRKRGVQFMQALQNQLPNVKLLCFFQMSNLLDFMDEPDEAKLMSKLSTHAYGLLPAFLNGILDTARSNTEIIDGNEGAYYYSGRERFLSARNIIKKKALNLIAPENHSKYSNQVKLGHALYIDYLFALGQPNKKLPSNYLTSEQRAKWLEHNTYYALSKSDEYVWCYSEEMNWWKNKVPDGVEKAIVSARQKIKTGEPLGFDIEEMTRRAQKMMPRS